MVPSASPVRVGEILDGKFEVERVLGQGGMGIVVAAKHLVLRERVALKFLLPDAAARPEVAARFRREAQAAARIRSEHVARVTDVGTLPSGAPYMVMEYLEGQDLGAILAKEGPLPIARAVDFVLQACVAVAEAHKAGIVHRDLKPANLFATTRGDGEICIKVLDFGISKLIEDVGQEKLTSGHLGTPAYMSPEQLRSAAQVDHRTDVWAMGAILFELTTGVYAFEAESLAELFAAILSTPPIALRARRQDAPAGLELALLHCLEKDRERRFQDVGAFAAAIAPFGGPTAAALLQRIGRTLGRPVHSDVTPGAGASPPVGAIDAMSGGASPGSIPRATALGTSHTLGGRSGPRSRALIASVAVATAAALGAGAFFAWRAVTKPAPTAVAAPTEASNLTAEPSIASESTRRAGDAPAPPEVSVAPLASVSASPAPSVSTPASAAAATPPRLPVHRPGRPTPEPARSSGAPPPKPTATDDYGGRK